MNTSNTGTRQFMGSLGRRGENTQGLRISDTDTRQYLGGLDRHMRVGMTRVSETGPRQFVGTVDRGCELIPGSSGGGDTCPADGT